MSKMLFWIIAFFPTIFSTSIPCGVQYNYEVSELLALGFTQCYSVTYSTGTTIPLLRSACPDPGSNGTIFIGGQEGVGASRIILGAFASYSEVFTETSSLTTATLRNGAYWYNYPLKGFGFAAVPIITLSICDTVTTTNSSSRLCWHLSSGGTLGGFRLGTIRFLNSNTLYYKVAYTKAGPASFTCPTSPPTIAPSSNPTITPSAAPSLSPTSSPTWNPTLTPTLEPTLTPTSEPTSDSTISPTLSTNPKSVKSSSKRSMKSTTIIALIVGIGGGCLLCCILFGLWYRRGKSGSGGKVYAEKTPEVMMT